MINISSRVCETIRTILNQFIFSTKRFWVYKKQQSANHSLLEDFWHEKLLPWFLFACFCFCWLVLVWFEFLYVQNLSLKNKEINWLEIVLIASYTLLLTCTPINPPIENLFAHIYFHLWSSVRMSFENLFHLWFDFIWSFLSFHENKKAYEYHCLKQIFYHQNTIMIFCWFDMSWFALNSFNFMSDYFLVEQSVFESIKLSYNIESFLLYWILYYQYFSWNTSLTFIQQIYQLFLLLTRLSFLPITFLWVGSKNFESWG